VNRAGGVVRADWNRLYQGSEGEYYHAATMPGDGSLLRVKVTPPEDSRKLYRQRTVNPGPGSDFSQWEYSGQYNAIIVAAASLGSEVSIIWVKTNKEIRRTRSMDNGASWGSAELIDYTVSATVSGLAAAYNPGGDLAIFFADQDKVYVKRQDNGQWQAKAAWDKTTGILSGVTTLYDSDWQMLVTGRDTAGNYKLWAITCGDGGSVPAGSWSALQELASAPAAGQFEYRQPSLDKPDVFRCCFIENFTGTDSYSRPYLTHSIPGTTFGEGLWREAEPFDLTTEYGLAMANHGNEAWLSMPSGVWRASMAEAGIDLTADVISVRQKAAEGTGSLAVELKNDDGKYAAPGEGGLGILNIGCQIKLAAGYVTPAGNEYSPGSAYRLEAYEHTSGSGRASLVLHARDGWKALADWSARQQLRWNRAAAEKNVRDIMAFILGRAGLRLEVKSGSGVITGFYPDFTVSPGENGTTAIKKLISFVPDVIFIEGDDAYLVNPLSTDGTVYAYGVDHMIFEGSYRCGSPAVNRVQVEGYDIGTGGIILADRFNWNEIKKTGERFTQVGDRNLNTAEAAGQRGEAVLRRAEMEAADGEITVPVNCGQQIYDVIEVTDMQAGLVAQKKRVLGLTLVYQPGRGEYRHCMALGAV
jgi:hypothetical protein